MVRILVFQFFRHMVLSYKTLTYSASMSTISVSEIWRGLWWLLGVELIHRMVLSWGGGGDMFILFCRVGTYCMFVYSKTCKNIVDTLFPIYHMEYTF